MSFFEFILVAISMMLALAAARAVEGLYEELTSGRAYWVHATRLLLTIGGIPLYLVATWRLLANTSDETLMLTLLIASAPPTFMFLQAHALATSHPADVSDWRTHYYEIRRPYFLLGMGLALSLFATAVHVNPTWTRPEIVGPRALLFAFALIGFVSSNARVQAALAVLTSLNVALGFFAVLAQSS